MNDGLASILSVNPQPLPISRIIHYLKMAEPFGIIAGAISISSAFTACVDCFEYIQLGRHFGRDFQMDQLAIGCARLRLTLYG